ncbi:hypothetical protein [Haliangium sp.]|uniref:hypothetical protein n=1 Tax=Haliangium sp. TaxID=2663208 RepID=UPI003D0C315F
MRQLGIAIATLTLLLAAGCEELDTPAELDRPQILAVRAAPAHLSAGQRAQLSLLIAGPEGDLTPTELDWAVIGPGAAAAGSIEIDDDGAHYRAPDQPVGEPRAVTLQVTAVMDDGAALIAEKLVFLGDDSMPEPLITEVLVDGVAASERVEVAPSDVVELALRTEAVTLSDPAQEPLTTWHTTCGTFDPHREPVVLFEAPTEPCHGMIYAVFRDGLGGVAWRRIEVEITSAAPTAR